MKAVLNRVQDALEREMDAARAKRVGARGGRGRSARAEHVGRFGN